MAAKKSRAKKPRPVAKPCPNCKGEGQVVVYMNGEAQFNRTCKVCIGLGRVR
jgi:DnaJ-class molecular chaperone